MDVCARKNMISVSTLRLAFFFLIFFVCPVSSKDVKCYVCHYSPSTNQSTEDTDKCYGKNFVPGLAQEVLCPNGCERVTQYDLNNELEHFHRNCFKTNESVTEGCKTTKTKAYERHICVCTSDRCNNSNVLNSKIFSSILFAFVTIWLSSRVAD